MPPKKLTDEEKEEQFEKWKSSDEYEGINKYVGERGKVKPIDLAVMDVSDDYQPMLNALFDLQGVMKIKCKAKQYEQQYFRTMFFEKCDTKNIDGKVYDISNNAKVDCFNCKEAISEVFRFLDPENMENECTFDNWQSWKKDLTKVLKEWEKCYSKHVKSTYPEMNAIHNSAM